MAISKPCGIIPVGGVVAWLKSFTGTPTLNDEYVECNGQNLSDAQSVYNGKNIPDLNGDDGVKRFLRGSTTSGSTGGSETHSHDLTIGCFIDCGTVNTIWDIFTTAVSTLPSYYEVVWVMRIK